VATAEDHAGDSEEVNVVTAETVIVETVTAVLDGPVVEAGRV
jgi:hypothetical protein